MPEGQVVISGFNTVSLWRLRQAFTRRRNGAPWDAKFIGVLRLREWLRVLGFELNGGKFGCYAPPFEDRAMARALFVHGQGRRAMVAGDRRRLCRSRGEACARHAHRHACVAKGAGAAPGAPPVSQRSHRNNHE